MNGKSASPYDKLMEGKRRLARTHNNPDTLERALEYIDAALIDHLRSIAPSADIGPYQLFINLQKDHIIDASERALISSMHSLRNKTAHANPHYLTQHNVERYAALAKTIMDKTASRKRMGAKPKQRTSDRPRTNPQKRASNRPSPLPQARHQPVAAPSITEPSPVETPEPTLPLQVKSGSNESARLNADNVSPPEDSSPKTESDDELLRRLLLTP